MIPQVQKPKSSDQFRTQALPVSAISGGVQGYLALAHLITDQSKAAGPANKNLIHMDNARWKGASHFLNIMPKIWAACETRAGAKIPASGSESMVWFAVFWKILGRDKWICRVYIFDTVATRRSYLRHTYTALHGRTTPRPSLLLMPSISSQLCVQKSALAFFVHTF